MKDKKKKNIIKTAEALFNRFGIAKTAVDQIAAKAMVARGTIYNYFGSKEGLIREIIMEKTRAIETIIKSAKSPAERIKLALIEKIKMLRSTPFLSDSELGASRELNSIITEMETEQKKLLSSIIETASKGLAPSARGHVISGIHFAIAGIENAVKNQSKRISIKDIEKDIEFIIKMMIPAQKTGKTKNGND